jgi:hypothetical protein
MAANLNEPDPQLRLTEDPAPAQDKTQAPDPPHRMEGPRHAKLSRDLAHLMEGPRHAKLSRDLPHLMEDLARNLRLSKDLLLHMEDLQRALPQPSLATLADLEAHRRRTLRTAPVCPPRLTPSPHPLRLPRLSRSLPSAELALTLT